MTDLDILAKLDDVNALALTLWGEARGERAGRIAVGCVVRNRIPHHAMYGADDPTYKSVCLAPRQFSCWNPGSDANHAQLMALAEQVTESVPITDALFPEMHYLAAGIIGGQITDWTGGATFYLTAALLQANPPSWVRRLRQTVKIEDHVFFTELHPVN